jgi:AraC-like DNA-binding protein
MPRRSARAPVFSPTSISLPDLPEVASVGYNVWTRRRPHELDDHAHQDVWEIHYLVEGQIVEEVAGASYVMRGGDVLIAPPGVVHTGINRVRHRCGLCWLGVRLHPKRALPGMTSAQTALLRAAFTRLGARPFAGDPALPPAFAGLLREAARGGGLQPLLCRAYLHQILGLLTRPVGEHVANPSPRSREVAAAVTLLSERLEFPLRIASLPARVGLGRSALNERFVAEMGVTPVEFRTQLRLEEAKRHLGSAGNAEVARRLGFTSPQHFATAFRRAFGCTPGAWRRRVADR